MNPTDSQREERSRQFLERHGLAALALEDLDWALTHRSYAYESAQEADNERLEFLGDSLIAAITSEYLFNLDPEADEGTLSKRRSHLVSRHLLGRRALDMGLDELILLGRGERDTGGANRRSTLGSALEALVAIVYLRLGFEVARQFVHRHLLEALDRMTEAELGHGDYKSALQEWAQQHYKTVPVYTRVSEQGPDHDKQFFVQVELAGQPLAIAGGRRIKIAENESARLALEKIKTGEITPAHLPPADPAPENMP